MQGSGARRTGMIIMASTALHAALALAFLTRAASAGLGPASVEAVVVSQIDLPPGADVAPLSPAPETAEALATEQAEEPPADSVAASREPSGPAPSAPATLDDEGGCALPQAVLAALQTPSAREALSRIPTGGRSVANAILLWNGGWVRDGALADVATAEPIRRAVSEAVRASPPACAAALVSGPVLIMAPDRDGALIVVVGSGAWRWGDLASSETG